MARRHKTAEESSAEQQLEDHKHLSGLPHVDPKQLANRNATQIRERVNENVFQSKVSRQTTVAI